MLPFFFNARNLSEICPLADWLKGSFFYTLFHRKRVKSLFIQTNPNPKGKMVSDCTVRALALALEKSWGDVAAHTFSRAYEMCDMPSSNQVWGAYLEDMGYVRHTLPDTCPNCYTISDFAREHPNGIYVVCCDGHVVCVRGGNWLDTWDSGDMTAIYYWEKGETNNA